jgi:hypothetical protein
MLHKRKETLFAFVAVASLIFCVFMLLSTTNTTLNVSAVEANGVGVYWDSNCTDKVFSIDWGNLTAGSSKSIIVYIRNEVEEPTYLIMSTMNWTPPTACDYMTLGWNYAGQRMNPGEALQITLTLSVTRHIEGISNFSFNISITGSNRLPGDINGDGKVDWQDLALLGLAYNSSPGDRNWNPAADLNGDGKVDWQDLAIFGLYYGKSY